MFAAVSRQVVILKTFLVEWKVKTVDFDKLDSGSHDCQLISLWSKTGVDVLQTLFVDIHSLFRDFRQSFSHLPAVQNCSPKGVSKIYFPWKIYLFAPAVLRCLCCVGEWWHRTGNADTSTTGLLATLGHTHCHKTTGYKVPCCHFIIVL